MNRDELIAWLGIEPGTLDELLAAGLPHAGGLFDGYLVAAWLEQRGLARRTGFHGCVSTLREVASAFGVSAQTVKGDWKKGGMPGRPGNYDLAEIAAWKQLRGKDPLADSETTQATNDFLKRRLAADARKKEAEAARIERQNRQAEHDMLARDDVESAISQLIIATRESLRNIPRAMMPRFPRRQARELAAELETHIERRLQQMSQWRPRFGGGEEPPATPEEAAEDTPPPRKIARRKKTP